MTIVSNRLLRRFLIFLGMITTCATFLKLWFHEPKRAHFSEFSTKILNIEDRQTEVEETLPIYEDEHQHISSGRPSVIPNPSNDIKPEPLIDCERELPTLHVIWDRLVIVTAISENHVKEAFGMIASAQKYMPKNRIIVYDLGITKMKSLEKIKRLCNVEVRRFEFEKYPPHVRDLHTYAWKVLIIKETLWQVGAIFYGDSSVRFRGSLRVLFPYLYLNHCYMFHIHSYDPKLPAYIKHQYFFTHQAMYTELGVNRTEYFQSNQSAPHISAGRVLMINDSLVNEKILQPLTECALKESCIAPEGAVYGEHRFDASALAIIVYKNMRLKWTPENRNTSSDVFDRLVKIRKIEIDGDKVRTC